MSVKVQISAEERADLEECVQKILLSQDESNPKKLQQLKTPLKSWIGSLIEKQASRSSSVLSEENEVVIPEDFSLVRHVKYKIELGRNEIAQKNRVKHHLVSRELSYSKTQSTLNSSRKRTHSNTELLSEIAANNKSHAFSKAKRSLDFSSPGSPGPAVYNIRTSIVENPCHLFAKCQDSRSAFLKSVRETPGPGEYNPSKHYSSN